MGGSILMPIEKKEYKGGDAKILDEWHCNGRGLVVAKSSS